ncbi:hypothetical protein L198_06580 [Cryptococcus wingfieldii CBS 7118]|uniref:Uncharacterized protein n=1 Tax=Cryptococcus wingfieldii CBS 7118 TaxID=1295528 RepID=A0A1E3IJT6_9TREE|nr:hypothetical protein L198_06580 [Cryptococcus wingfieldii CBS 7118]ODN88778.1 hypothetical protein L198_06580 [Cryptococcus wingfieldii CBS 7118]
MVLLKSPSPLLPSSPDLRWHRSDRRPSILKYTLLLLTILYLTFLAFTFDPSSLPLPASVAELTDSWNGEYSWGPAWASSESGGGGRDGREAYVTFLSSVADPWYLLSTRLLLWQLQHYPSTADLARPFIVLATPSIPSEVCEQLEKEGAQVQKVELLDGFPLPEGMEANHHWKDQYTKLHIFNQTAFSRLLYLDNDMLLLKSLSPIWDNVPSSFEGVGGVGERSKGMMAEDDTRRRPEEGEVRDYLNAGFLLVKPDGETFEELRGVREYNPFYMEQATGKVIIHGHRYKTNSSLTFLVENNCTMGTMRMSSSSSSHWDSTDEQCRLHAKMWKDEIDREVVDLWEAKVGQMEDYFGRL